MLLVSDINISRWEPPWILCSAKFCTTAWKPKLGESSSGLRLPRGWTFSEAFEASSWGPEVANEMYLAVVAAKGKPAGEWAGCKDTAGTINTSRRRKSSELRFWQDGWIGMDDGWSVWSFQIVRRGWPSKRGLVTTQTPWLDGLRTEDRFWVQKIPKDTTKLIPQKLAPPLSRLPCDRKSSHFFQGGR